MSTSIVALVVKMLVMISLVATSCVGHEPTRPSYCESVEAKYFVQACQRQSPLTAAAYVILDSLFGIRRVSARRRRLVLDICDAASTFLEQG